MNIGKICFVNAGNDSTLANPNDGSFPALGVVSLGTVVEKYRPEISVRVFDGNVTPQDYIEQQIGENKPEVVGISVLGASYHNSLSIAKVAKEAGAITIFGNDQAAVLGRNMMRKREEIDYISTADVGEFAFLDFLDFLEGRKRIEEVPKLMYRTAAEINFNNMPEVSSPRSRWNYLDAIPIPNRKLLNKDIWNAYLRNYLSRYASMHSEPVSGVATINRARGCSRVKDACGFCGIQDLSLRFSSPGVFWSDVREAKEDVGANIVYEVFDSMSSAPRWIEMLVESKPEDLADVKFFVYTQTLETTPRLVNLYKKLGVFRVNIGFESGDDVMLKRMKGPRDSVEIHKRAARFLSEAGIKIYGSLVPGAPGETKESLKRTVEFARWLLEEEVVAAVEAQPLWPEFNSKFGKWLMNPELAQEAANRYGFKIKNMELLKFMQIKYRETDTPDTDEISREWASIFCEADYDDLLESCQTIMEYAKKARIPQGSAISPNLNRCNERK